MKNGGKNKCCVYNFGQCVYIYIYMYMYICVCVCVCTHTATVMAKNIGTFGKYDQYICIVNPFDLLFKKKSQKIPPFIR